MIDLDGKIVAVALVLVSLAGCEPARKGEPVPAAAEDNGETTLILTVDVSDQSGFLEQDIDIIVEATSDEGPMYLDIEDATWDLENHTTRLDDRQAPYQLDIDFPQGLVPELTFLVETILNPGNSLRCSLYLDEEPLGSREYTSRENTSVLSSVECLFMERGN